MSFLIGLCAGIFGGLFGLGGGLVMVPLMVGVKKIGQHRAHGTSLVALVVTGLAGAFTYAMKGAVDLRASGLLAVTAMLTVRAGARYAHALPEWKLKRFFGVFLIPVTGMMFLKPHLLQHASPLLGWMKVLALLATGMLTGCLSGMMGVGGGTVMVPAMVLLLGMDQYTAQGTSLLAMVPAGTVGAFTHGRLGNIERGLLLGLIPGISLGTYVGGTLAHALQEGSLRTIFAAVLLWTGFRYLRTPSSGRDGGCKR